MKSFNNFILLAIFSAAVTFGQNETGSNRLYYPLNDYAGTYDSKFEISDATLNKIEVTVSSNDEISFKIKIKKDSYSENNGGVQAQHIFFDGKVSGKISISSDMGTGIPRYKFQASGKGSYYYNAVNITNLTMYRMQKGYNGKKGDDDFMKIPDPQDATVNISGDLYWKEDMKTWVIWGAKIKELGNLSLPLIPLSRNSLSNTEKNKEKNKNDCNCEIIVPDDLKPGNDFYVVVKRDGCVSSDKLFYNGKDNPIANWDGNPVKVTLQYTCCDTRGYEKILDVPKYGSEDFNKLVKKHTEIKKQEQQTGKLPAANPKQLIAGTTLALLILKMLQIILSGKGSTSSKVPPPTVPKPPVVPPKKNIPEDKKEIKKDEKNNLTDPKKEDKALKKSEPKKEEPKKEEHKQNEQKKEEPKQKEVKETKTEDKNRISPQEKQIKLKELQLRQDKLIEEAKNEHYSLTSPFTFVKHMFQTVPASVNEVKELGRTVIKAKEKIENEVDGFVAEVIANPKERARLTNNLHQMTLNAFNYVDSGNMKKDVFNLGKKIVDNNIAFVRKLAGDPKKTTVDYLSSSFGTENFTKAFDHNNSLGNRLLNLGTGYFKTFTMISTGGSGISVLKNFATGKGLTLNNLFKTSLVIFKHQTNLGSMKLHEKFPQIKNEISKVLMKEYVKLKADNLYKEFMKRPEETTSLHNMNDYLERYDRYLNASNN